MTKHLSKAIMNKSSLRSKYLKWPSRGHLLEHKKPILLLFQERALLKTLWNTVKPVLKNKGFLLNENIALKPTGEIITDTIKLAYIFNTHYINIVEKSSGTPPNIKGNPENPLEDSITFEILFKEYENHPSVININNQNLTKRSHETDFATTNQVKEVDQKKPC